MFDFNKVVFPLYDDLYQLHEVNGNAKFLLFTLGPFGKGILNCFYGDHDRISFILSSSIIPYEKYNLGEKIEHMLKDLNLPNIAIQMEVYGDGVQKRNYSMDNGERKIAVFHILSNNIKMPMEKVVELCEKYDLPHVPIIDNNYVLPDTIEELQTYVESAPSAIDGLDKEGIVFYDKKTGIQYFKFVSPSFLMKYNG